ncbi:MAG: hypothetical protein SFY81_12440 [Verrucomicrobiota bacterium]|nr:hypothetical protein [Verrucomicrobiota bacterium]
MTLQIHCQCGFLYKYDFTPSLGVQSKLVECPKCERDGTRDLVLEIERHGLMPKGRSAVVDQPSTISKKPVIKPSPTPLPTNTVLPEDPRLILTIIGIIVTSSMAWAVYLAW